jgi:ABC-2 type transport system ATP-binding protein
MLQRIGIAQALINDPKLVILDEPMSGLDPIGRKEVRDLILRLKGQGKTVFFSSHIIPDVEMVCDRVGILVKGRLKDIGHLNEILETRIKYTEVVIGACDDPLVNALDPFSGGYSKSGEQFIFRIASEDNLEKVLVTVMNLKGKIISVLPIKETLEEHFIRESKEGNG